MRGPVHNGVWVLIAAVLAVTLALTGCGGTGLDLSPAPTGTPVPTPLPFTPGPVQVQGLALVARTGGEGVYLRTLPSNAPEVRGDVWTEGTQVEVVGQNLEAAGREWMRVRDPKGGVGYIPAEFLVTTTPTNTPLATATNTPAPSPSITPTAAATETKSPTPKPTLAPSPPPTSTPTATVAVTNTPVPTQAAPTATPGQAPTETPAPEVSPTPTAAVAATVTPLPQTGAKLALLSAVESKSVAFATVEGFVRNISNMSLENVQVVVRYLASDGRTVARGSAGIANPFLGPSQTSAFKVLVPMQPGMETFEISFLDGSGQPVESVDQR